MTVLGAIDNNGTNITCVAVSFNPPSLDKSPPAVIYVYEHLHKQGVIIIILANPSCALQYTSIHMHHIHFDLHGFQRIFVKHAGLLESVSNLTATFINSTTVLISWSSPFTPEAVPILGYNVTVTSTTSGDSETMLVVDTTLLYSIDSDNEFTITVVPINAVGPGQLATIYFPLNPSKLNLITIVTQCAICPAGL